MAEPMRAEEPPSGPTVSGVVPILRVEKLEASLAYYSHQLGFDVHWRTGPMGSVRRGSTSIMLFEGDQGHPGTWLWIGTSDVDALYGEFQRRGARLRHPPTDYPWGSRECQISDLDGHVLRFASPSAPDARFGEWLDGQGRRWFPYADGSWRLVDGL